VIATRRRDAARVPCCDGSGEPPAGAGGGAGPGPMCRTTDSNASCTVTAATVRATRARQVTAIMRSRRSRRSRRRSRHQPRRLRRAHGARKRHVERTQRGEVSERIGSRRPGHGAGSNHVTAGAGTPAVAGTNARARVARFRPVSGAPPHHQLDSPSRSRPRVDTLAHSLLLNTL
jgi:hypothetical protein